MDLPSRLRKNSIYTQNAVGIFHMASMSKQVQDAQKGRPARPQEQRGEEVRTAHLLDRSPVEWILANGKSPPVLPASEKLSSTLSL